jgi:4-amino-4-deoxy-L-arabinose transferase-like glycosyltransferase
LAKGPVAPFFALAIVVIFSAGKRDYRLIARTCWLPGIGLFALTALPWYIAVQLKNPEFFRVFILEHNLGRFGKDLYHHTQPFWYYVPVALLGLVPWTTFISVAMVESIRLWWRQKRELFRFTDALPVFLLPGYIVPALPAGTLLLAEYVRRHATEDVTDNGRPSFVLIILHSLVAALPVVAALMMQYLVFQHALPWNRATAISAGFAAVLAIGITLTLYRPMGLRLLRFVTLVPVVLGLGAALRLGAPALDASLSARPLAQEINRVDNRSLPVAVLRVSRETEFGLHFYRNQKIARYEAGEVPPAEHLLITPAGWQKNIAKWTPGRRFSYVGSVAAQGVDYYWVARSQ